MVSPLFQRVVITPAPSIRRIWRWMIVATVPLLLLAMLLIGMQDWSVAQAAGPFTVGTCTGAQTHPTIQAAVNAASAGAVINICPNTYSESVNLSLMSGIGDITLRRVPGKTGAVQINPLTGAAIYISSTASFTGNITIESIHVFALNADGINFYDTGDVNGNIVISNVTALNNWNAGADIGALGTILVANSNFSDNGEFGLSVYAAHSIEVVTTQANHNGHRLPAGVNGTGIYISSYDSVFVCDQQAQSTADHVVMDQVTANENEGWGINLESTSDTFITATVVMSNSYDGLYSDLMAGVCEDPPVLEMKDSTAINNGTYALGPNSDVAVASFYELGGFRLSNQGPISVQGSEADRNYSFGFCIDSESAIVVDQSRAEHNYGDGFLYAGGCDGYYVKGKVAAEGEGQEIQGPPANSPEIVISNATANANEGTGFGIFNQAEGITLTRVSATNNLTGVAFFPGELSYFDASAGSEQAGGQAGVQGGEFAIAAEVPSPSTLIDDSLIQYNSVLGIYYGQPLSPILPFDTTATIVSENVAKSSIVCLNGAGVVAEQYEPIGPVSIDSPVQGDYQMNVDVRGNWWGDATGPGGSGHPSGQGDTIESTELDAPTNTVTVQFEPWISLLGHTAAPNPTFVGTPVQVEYQAKDDLASYFLRNGVGDPNNGPLFHLSVPSGNGAVVGDPDKFIVNTLITGTVNPNSPGPMTVTLKGPCGLDSTQNLFVAAPGIDIQESPKAQGVAPGGAANFTVTVVNTGNITLTNVVVTDTVAPNCARTTGAVGDIAVGDSAIYTCALNNVQNNLVNTVNASGQAEFEGAPVGSAIGASDTANVFVASFAFTKTVFVDGFHEQVGTGFNSSDCALHSTTTVPAGTTVKYCYTITNTGDYTLTTHTLVDDHFPNALLNNVAHVLAPGESFSNLDAGVLVTQTLTVSTTNVATWTAEIGAPIIELGAEAVNLSIPVTAQAVVTISSNTLDQDEDGIPDNVEGAVDVNNNGIPDFLDPTGPTAEPPREQPGKPNAGKLFLPSLGND